MIDLYTNKTLAMFSKILASSKGIKASKLSITKWFRCSDGWRNHQDGGQYYLQGIITENFSTLPRSLTFSWENDLSFSFYSVLEHVSQGEAMTGPESRLLITLIRFPLAKIWNLREMINGFNSFMLMSSTQIGVTQCLYLASVTTGRLGTSISYMLQMRKLRHREIK